MTGTVRRDVTACGYTPGVAMTPAERQRKHREKNGQRVGNKRGPLPSEPCGTYAAFRRHQRNGEAIDAACRAAYNEKQRGFQAARRARARGAT